MTARYFVWASKRVKNACTVEGLQGLDEKWRLAEGQKQGEAFPDGVTIAMDPDSPNDTILLDNVKNTDLLVIVSVRLRELLEGRSIPDVEYLPVEILNHKARKAEGSYFIVNPYQPIDCIDKSASELEWSEIEPDSIDYVGELVLDEEKIDSETQLFRLKHLENVIVAREDLTQTLDNAGVTGIEWEPIDEFSI